MKGLLVPGPNCLVPGCTETKDERYEDTCSNHGRRKAVRNTIPNDGVIDWLAIDLLIGQSREVAVTWLERDIAAARLAARDWTEQSIESYLGIYIETEARRKEIACMAEAIRTEGCARA